MTDIIPLERISNKIFYIRMQHVLLDKDLAELYGVETKQLKRAVRRNLNRFPEDFMFELTNDEFQNLKYHFGASSWGGTRFAPMAFTEQGVAMLSSVLKSERAVQVNIAIMRAFVQLRKMAVNYSGLQRKIEDMEGKYEAQFKIVFEAIKKLMEPPSPKTKGKIGFQK